MAGIMDRRFGLLIALALPVACTIFDGLTPSAPSDAGKDREADAGPPRPACDDAGACVPGQGLCVPEALCSPSAPCDDGVVLTIDGGVTHASITSQIAVPACKTQVAHPLSSYDDSAKRMTWSEDAGAPRAACVYEPPGSTPKPLVVFLHRLGGSADDVYNLTSLRKEAATTDLGDGAGFALAADQGDNLHSALDASTPGPNHDFYYRDFARNPDFESVDHVVDTLVAGGKIDTARIYVMGWGEGAFFAEAYAIVRNVTATPGGSRVAAAAVYEGADPFQSPTTARPDCKEATYPRASVPIYLLHRSCSLVACDSTQATTFGLPPGFDVETWAATPSAVIQDQIIDELGAPATSCAQVCGLKEAASKESASWPSGWETEMLAFLAKHSL